jgi:hypothetical protein
MSAVQKVSVTSERKFHLGLALDLILEWPRDSLTLPDRVKAGSVSHWKVENGGLVFGWHANMKDAVPLPAKMEKDALIGLILGWLADAEYGEEPDHDGSNHKGYTIKTTGWEDSYATFRVEPTWIEYGK